MTAKPSPMVYEHTGDTYNPPMHFTYYPVSGGVVVTSDTGEVLDAGCIREPGVITARELQQWAVKWVIRRNMIHSERRRY